MKLVIFSIVLDGQPFIEQHLPVFEKLNIPWEWRIAEGRARNVKDTVWCKSLQPRLSNDGTSEYLTKISKHPNVKVFRKMSWDGKVDMCNACVADIKEECVLLQCDVDEFFTVEQMHKIVNLFEENPHILRARFYCRYFIGRDIIAVADNHYGNRQKEWLRAFRFKPGDCFERHEPPVIKGNLGPEIDREETRKMGLVFDHFAWLTEKQAIEKEKYYGYANAAECWRRLQENKVWPVPLKQFFHWADDGAMADIIG